VTKSNTSPYTEVPSAPRTWNRPHVQASLEQIKLKGISEHDDELLEYLKDIVSTAGLEAPIETASAEVGRLGEERAENVKLETDRKEVLSWQKLANEHIRAESALAILPVAVLHD